nr:hypothetical protein [Gammaproteobacteria bacterium]
APPAPPAPPYDGFWAGGVLLFFFCFGVAFFVFLVLSSCGFGLVLAFYLAFFILMVLLSFLGIVSV